MTGTTVSFGRCDVVAGIVGGRSPDAEAAYERVIGRRVRVLRVLAELSQDELAHRAGVTRNFVSAIERGSQRLDVLRARRLADGLGIDLGELLAEVEPDAVSVGVVRFRG